MNNQSMFQMNGNWLIEPFRELIELNQNTVKSLEYVNLNELLSIKNSEQLIEKNMKIIIRNSHKTLDYMQNMFHIVEKNWFSIRNQLVENTEESIKKTQKATRQNSKKIFNLSEYAVGAESTGHAASRSSKPDTKRSSRANSKTVKKTESKVSSKSK